MFTRKSTTLKEALPLHKHDIISVVGSGGKTTLLFAIAESFRSTQPVLITTTTKMSIPEAVRFDYFFEGALSLPQDAPNISPGIYFWCTKTDRKCNKVIGIPSDAIRPWESVFDLILIEADGSRQLPIKAWKEWEPVIPEETTVTIAVFPVTCFYEIVREENTYHFEGFLPYLKDENRFTPKVFLRLLTDPNGMWKGAQGTKILYLSQADTTEQKEMAMLFLEEVAQLQPNLPYKIVMGSTLRDEYAVIQ